MREDRLTKMDLRELARPFPPEAIKFKIQATSEKPGKAPRALVVSYIDARDVMDRLDAVAGGDWWDNYRVADSGGLECALTVMGVTRRDVGATDNPNEAAKSAYSDAFKRAAVKFGIGRFLYSLPKMWIAVEKRGKSRFIPEVTENMLRQKIAGLLGIGTPGQAGPEWTPEVAQAGEEKLEEPDRTSPTPTAKPVKSGNGRPAVRTKEWFPRSTEIAKMFPRYQNRTDGKPNGTPNQFHLLGAAGKCGFAEITDDNLDDVLAAVVARAAAKVEKEEKEEQENE